MTHVLIAGGVSYNTLIYMDDFPQPHPQTIFSQRYHETVGSTGAGKAFNLAPLVERVTLHALRGEDDAGERVSAALNAAGIPFHYDVDPTGTKRHVNLMDQHGGRITIHINPGIFEPAIDLAKLEPLIAGCNLVALNIINYCRALIPLCKRHGKPLWVDIHDYDGQADYHQDFIDAADVLHMSSDALPDYRPFMQAQIAAGKQLVICTHGKDGATALTAAGEWIETPIIDAYDLVDSNGAGDAFFAGVLYGHVQGYPTAVAMRIGAIVSGLCITAPDLSHADLSPALIAAEYQRHYGTAL
jgi:sugar/nucleoside kinase (ribokinase family)